MTAIKCLKILRKTVCFLLLWNLIITGVVICQYTNNQTDKLNQQICTLEEIPNYDTVPDYELVEVR